MIKILFDHQIFSEQHFGGISRYFANLVGEINKNEELEAKISVLYTKNYYIRNYKQSFNNIWGRLFLRKDSKRYYWNRKYSKSVLKRSMHDVFHATYYDPYSLSYNTRPLVITIHDMIYENSPEMFVDSDLIISQKKQMMNAADAIIAISNFTKNEILKFYPEYTDKITVVYHGLPNEESIIADSQITLPKRFILFVGERGNYKNFTVLIKAITPLLLKEKDLKVICAGGKNFTVEEKAFLEKNNIHEQCTQLNVTDEMLKKLYQEALAFAYPSSQEGFGLPMLEAFKNNCPIVCSNTSCLPEIGEDAVEYFNPEDENSILKAVEKVIFNPSYAEELIKKGQERLAHFSMEGCVEKTVQVYKSLLAKR